MNQVTFNQCSICNEFYKGELDSLYRLEMREINEKCMMTSRILYENEEFIVIPTLGPVSECHLLIMPKVHVCSFALLSSEQLIKADELIKKICNVVNNVYGRCILFEHGTLDEQMLSSASCNHAHMHIVSCDKSLIPYLKEDGLQLCEIKKFYELSEQKKRGLPYFYYSENNTKSFVMDDVVKKSQYMRILTAKALNTPEKGNWKKKLGVADIISMVIKIKKEFEKI